MNTQNKKTFVFFWAHENKIFSPEQLAAFFADNVHDLYISHGEIIAGRADSMEKWNSKLKNVISDELEICLANSSDQNKFQQAAVCVANENIAALVIMEYVRNTSVAILSDIIVDKKLRGCKIGERFIEWIEKETKLQQFKFIFLESGINNEGAHRFFKNAGYEQTSIVMMKAIS